MNTCRDNEGAGSGSDSDGACSIMPPAVTFESLRFDLSSVPPAPKSKPVPTYKAPFKKSVGGDVAGSPENSHKKKRNEIPSFGKELANTVRRSNQKRSVFSAFSAEKEKVSVPSLSSEQTIQAVVSAFKMKLFIIE